MVEIVAGKLVRNETNQNAMGGTEMMAIGLQERIPQAILKDFQIINSRPRELCPDLKKILVCHDLAGDPEVQHLKDGGYKQYDKLVFVSHWQFQQYHDYLGVPYSHSHILRNAIEPIEAHVKPDNDVIRLIYHTTPHRGLHLLYVVFDKLCERYNNLELDVYSSFKIYGWEQRDEEYKALFDSLKNHPKIRYHGSVPNFEIRSAVKESHIFAYPSTWQETSCIALLEAMSAGCLCVHPNYAALSETAAGWTAMYQWDESHNVHANRFYLYLDNAIRYINEHGMPHMDNQSMHINTMYNWESRIKEWTQFLTGM